VPERKPAPSLRPTAKADLVFEKFLQLDEQEAKDRADNALGIKWAGRLNYEA
jgi:hypothetical protein